MSYEFYYIYYVQGSIWNLLWNLTFASSRRLGRKQSLCLSQASLKDQLLARIYNMNINYVHDHDQE